MSADKIGEGAAAVEQGVDRRRVRGRKAELVAEDIAAHGIQIVGAGNVGEDFGDGLPTEAHAALPDDGDVRGQVRVGVRLAGPRLVVVRKLRCVGCAPALAVVKVERGGMAPGVQVSVEQEADFDGMGLLRNVEEERSQPAPGVAPRAACVTARMSGRCAEG